MWGRGPRAGRHFAIAIAAIFAVLAVIAGSASAAATTTKAEWYTGFSPEVTTQTGKQAISIATPAKAEMGFTVGGFPVKFRANAVTCVECTTTNESTGLPGVATGTGRLLFTEVAFNEVPSCKFKEGRITSEPLLFEAHYMQGERWMLKIGPLSGTTDLLLNIEKAKPESICPFEGANTTVKGTNFGEFESKTGVFALLQSVRFSLPISEEAGSNWTFGSLPFSFTSTLGFKAGGKYFGVK
jgi:hypothetical protein